MEEESAIHISDKALSNHKIFSPRRAGIYASLDLRVTLKLTFYKIYSYTAYRGY